MESTPLQRPPKLQQHAKCLFYRYDFYDTKISAANNPLECSEQPISAPASSLSAFCVLRSAFCVLRPFTLHPESTSRARASLGVLSPLVSLILPLLMSKATSEYSYKTSKEKKKSKQISIKATEPKASRNFLFIRQHPHGELRRSSHPHPQQT